MLKIGPARDRARTMGTGLLGRMVIASAILMAAPLAARAQGAQGAVVVGPGGGHRGTIDYENARPQPLPALKTAPPELLDVLLSAQSTSADAPLPSVAPGRPGDGKKRPVRLVAPTRLANSSAETIEPLEFGTAGQPYTTNRVNLFADLTVDQYPYRAAGKIFFNVGAGTAVCSGSLIKRGIVVTAAHCVADYGSRQMHTNFQFVPAYDNGLAPYGVWTAAQVYVPSVWFNGTDSCYAGAPGVVCHNDVALLRLNPQAVGYPGTSTGFLSLGVNGYGNNSLGQLLITQLGYPVALDSGQLMQRTDSQGLRTPSLADNTIIGSLQTGGSSGGPWIVNFGMPPTLAPGLSFGSASLRNVVVGVVSWGYTGDFTRKQMGASRLTSANVLALLTAACAAAPAACS